MPRWYCWVYSHCHAHVDRPRLARKARTPFPSTLRANYCLAAPFAVLTERVLQYSSISTSASGAQQAVRLQLLLSAPVYPPSCIGSWWCYLQLDGCHAPAVTFEDWLPRAAPQASSGMGRQNGHHHSRQPLDHNARHSLDGSFFSLPRPTPANLIGSFLFFFFASQLFTSTPFERVGSHRKLAEDAGSTSRVWKGTHLAVSKKSHAYLRSAFWDRSETSFTTNVSGGYEAAMGKLKDQESFYKPWIEKDLQPWKENGITKEGVDAAAKLYDVCDGDLFRFQVINGSLWVHHITERRNGWYPAVLGPENVAAKGRVPYALLALMDTLRAFPGEIPDLDAVFQTSDFPCIKRKWQHGAAGPTPMFGYQASVRHFDLPLPDHAFWGHEYQYLQDPWGNYAHGWDNQMEVMARKYQNVSLLDRIPQAMWRGRTQDKIYPHRDRLRRKFVECVDTIKEHPESLEGSIRPEDASLLSVFKPPVALQDTCDYRYPVYIESDAYASNLKTKLSCGSVLLVLEMEYFEFYARALEPGKHYIPVTRLETHVCEDIIPKIKAMNDMFASTGLSSLKSTGELTPTLKAQLEAMRKDKALAAMLTKASTPTDPPLVGPDGNYTWGSKLYPWEVAAEGQRFVREHLRMEDTLLYTRDMLKAYAARQKYKVKPDTKARCYTGDLLIEQFNTPHKADGEVIKKAYPWLKGYSGGCNGVKAS